jgi:protein-tyrosine phosphatase
MTNHSRRLLLLSGFATFLLATTAVAQRADTVRRLPLEGAHNFRDLGGYATTAGTHVRWGQVYRSGELAHLTAKDYEYLERLGIRTVCDFRTDAERNAHPTHWQGSNPPEILSLPGGAAERNARTPGKSVSVGASAEEVAANMRATYDANMRGTYERIVVVFGPSYGASLQRILNGTGPTLLHCTAGKDRTGVLSALLLLLLGVPRETVFEDYLLTNTYLEAERRAAMASALKDPTGTTSLMLADRSYLETALQTIDRKFGSLDNYRRTELGLSDSDLERLKARLLEK